MTRRPVRPPPRRGSSGVVPASVSASARVAALLAVLSAALGLGGCFASVSLGTGGVSVGAGGAGVRIGAGGGGVSVGVEGGGVSGRVSLPGRGREEGRAPATLMRKPLESGRLTSGFGSRRGRPHHGVDYAAPRGTSVYAAGDGVVTQIRRSASYGNYVRIRHGDGLESAYAHLAAFADELTEGGRVARGQVIGAVGDTGRASGTHLHYEVIREGAFVDPLALR